MGVFIIAGRFQSGRVYYMAGRSDHSTGSDDQGMDAHEQGLRGKVGFLLLYERYPMKFLYFVKVYGRTMKAR